MGGRRLAIPVFAAAALLSMPVAAASAAKSALPTTGPGLQPIGCVKDTTSNANCAQTTSGLADVEGITVTPGGETLYAAGFASDAVAWLNRAPDGSLSPGSCIDARTTGACQASFGPIGGPSDVEVAGGSAYSAGFTQGALVQYARGGDGSLTPTGCFATFDFDGQCTETPAPREHDDIAISPDGSSLYVAGGEVAHFSRAPGGSLSYVACADNSNPDCAVKGAGLDSAFAIDVSPDGQSVYSLGSNSVVQLNRAPDGSLTYGGSQTGAGMSTPFDIAVSPDGTSVYVVSFSSEAIARFDRAPDGSLTPAGCYAGPKGDPSCTLIPFSMKGAWSVAVSADGGSVYTTGQTADSVVSFARAADGSLTPAGCVLATDSDKGFERSASASAKDKTGECTILAEGMEDPRAGYTSPDGSNVYVGSDQGAVVAFRRDTEPPSTKVKGPKRTSSHRPKLKLKSSEPGSTFLCRVDNGGAKPCDAKFKPKLSSGKNKIQVAAVDPAGNPDPTPAKKKVTVTD
jgi:DNA-binding beta-propeller fold protein YncE